MKHQSAARNEAAPLIWNASRQLARVPSLSLNRLVEPGARVVVIAPHPGDEVHSCGGLLQMLSTLEHPLQLISITDGSGTYPGSRIWSEQRLSVVCPQETAEALRRLGIELHSLKWIRGGFRHGALEQQEDAIYQCLRRYLRPDDVVFTTWREDGDADHDAVGRASARACTATGARLVELPVWAWFRPLRDEGLIPWHRARKVRVDTWGVARKLHAIHAYHSQLQGDPERGIQPILMPALIERARQPFEMVFI
ncbi:PIG-L deacetylase family protein [Pseudomonas gingeri]|uniref:PIG-L family deacetylase n=1 Tax=Pseudomonas gingeri TaxID=117681 RepID=A0A7Y7Y9R9_9PSED|nr:PIG-L family deacetylase [Pseudomonas gingeri]NWA02438.1 PIG-L family deacetylase [Pseudomonas gingeri]NWA12389.1 PIG-L family deacetylase [Pseudomonas gingeri]NWA57205.1 PIG-L family deacetylase [Pseudomonas gingeri]NWA93548.1 PIG-L family deacetylase [Pseudomonas gingeri]NWB03020.1 PIG-L family deacetylase [Pseudomonas gingeri]